MHLVCCKQWLKVSFFPPGVPLTPLQQLWCWHEIKNPRAHKSSRLEELNLALIFFWMKRFDFFPLMWHDKRDTIILMYFYSIPCQRLNSNVPLLTCFVCWMHLRLHSGRTQTAVFLRTRKSCQVCVREHLRFVRAGASHMVCMVHGC